DRIKFTMLTAPRNPPTQKATYKNRSQLHFPNFAAINVAAKTIAQILPPNAPNKILPILIPTFVAGSVSANAITGKQMNENKNNRLIDKHTRFIFFNVVISYSSINILSFDIAAYMIPNQTTTKLPSQLIDRWLVSLIE